MWRWHGVQADLCQEARVMLSTIEGTNREVWGSILKLKPNKAPQEHLQLEVRHALSAANRS